MSPRVRALVATLGIAVLSGAALALGISSATSDSTTNVTGAAVPLAEGQPATEVPVDPIQLTPAQLAVTPSATPEEAVKTVLALAGPGLAADVGNVRVGPPPAAYAASGASWLYVAIAPSSTSDEFYKKWEVHLLQGGISDRLGSGIDQAKNLPGGTVAITRPDGSSDTEDLGSGNVQSRRAFPADSPAAIQAGITATLAKFALRLERLDVVDIDGPAPAVVTVTENPADTAARLPTLLQALFGDSTGGERYMGRYLEVRDTGGKTLIQSSVASRVGWGSVRWDPSIDSSISVMTTRAPIKRLIP
jgi:hypothetical protein